MPLLPLDNKMLRGFVVDGIMPVCIKEAPMQFASICRELTETDLSAPCAESETRAPQLERLKTKHHQIARLIADGLSDSQVCAAVGVTPAWQGGVRSRKACE